MLLKNKDTVLFIGDSVTDDGRKRPVGKGLWEGVGNGFVRQVDNMLTVLYPENTYNVINMGVSGNTSRDLLNRFEEDALSFNPDVLAIMIGVNDVWRQCDEPCDFKNHISIEEYSDNLRKIVLMAKGKVRELILMTPYFMETNPDDLMNAKVRAYAAEMKKIAAEYGITCIDIQKKFDEILQYRHSSYLSWDRVHPHHVGSLIIAREFLKTIGVDRELFNKD